MAEKVRVSDLDFVYISYKEPNKEENWADLLSKVPWAKRVDGVKGFDSAHKAAAEKAETDFFISVDGDNIIDEAFLLESLDWTKTNPKAVHRWRAKNNINGLVNGVAPNPVSFKELQNNISSNYKKPFLSLNFPKSFLTIPLSFLGLSDFYNDMIGSNKRVSSKKIQDLGYKFIYPALDKLK